MKTVFSLAATISAAMLVAAASTCLAGDTPQAPALPPNHPSAAFTAAPEPVWSPPANWLVAPSSAMVVKSFKVEGEKGLAAKIAVSAFGGNVGGTFANVNRWRAQIGLPAIEENALATCADSIAVKGGQATVVDLSNPDGVSTRLIAIIVPRGPNTWFYKMVGDTVVVAKEKAAFVKFVQTVTYP